VICFVNVLLQVFVYRFTVIAEGVLAAEEGEGATEPIKTSSTPISEAEGSKGNLTTAQKAARLWLDWHRWLDALLSLALAIAFYGYVIYFFSFVK
jgi:hypothetical protein